VGAFPSTPNRERERERERTESLESESGEKSRWESHGLLVVSRCLRTMIFFLISIIVVTH